MKFSFSLFMLLGSFNLFLISIPARAQVIEVCSVPGEAVQWQADYCLYETETDDIIAADPCMDREYKRPFRNDCLKKVYYKRKMCRMAVKDKTYTKGNATACEKDKDFSGPIVKNGGA